MSNADVLRRAAAEQRAKGNPHVLGWDSVIGGDGARSMPAPSGRGDPEVKAMLSEFDLLGLIRDDTGEAGRPSGGYVAFHRCPVCGHDDCFRYYPESGTWACFGASNGTGYGGGTALEYFKATRKDDDSEAVKWLREQTGHPYEKGRISARGDDAGAPGQLLPPMVHVEAVDPPPRRPPLIGGVLRRGHLGLLVGPGKAGKSWAAVELSACVATGGGTWMGYPVEGGGDVLYIDPEIDPLSMHNRFHEVCEAMGGDSAAVHEHVTYWPLRGRPAGIGQIVQTLASNGGTYSLVVVDSINAVMEGDENSSGDVRGFTNKALEIADITGASVLLVHHFGKGAAGDREASDRARGSSVWGDAPDAVLTFTEVFPPEGDPSDYLDDGESAFWLEAPGLREFPPRKTPKHIIWSWKRKLHRVDSEGATEGWKPKSSQSRGGKKTGELNKEKAKAEASSTVAALLFAFVSQGVGEDGMPIKDAAEACGCAVPTLERRLEGEQGGGYFSIVSDSPRKRRVVLTEQPGGQDPEGPGDAEELPLEQD